MASASSVRAGGATVVIGGDVTPFSRAMDKVVGKLNSLSSKVAGIGAAMAAAAGVILYPIKKMVEEVFRYVHGINVASQQTGMSVGVMSELAGMARLSGVEVGKLSAAVRAMQRNLVTMGRSGGPAAEVLTYLGINLRTVQRLKPEQQFVAISQAIAKIENPATRAYVATQIFGDSVGELMPLIQRVGTDLAGFRREMHQAGVVVSEDLSNKIELLNRIINYIKNSFMGLRIAITNALLPYIIMMGVYIARGVDWLRQYAAAHPDVIQKVFRFALMLLAVGAALGFVAATLKVAAILFNPLILGATLFMVTLAGVLEYFGFIDVGLLDLMDKFRLGGKAISTWWEMAWDNIYYGWVWLSRNIALGVLYLADKMVSALKYPAEFMVTLAENLGMIDNTKAQEMSDKILEYQDQLKASIAKEKENLKYDISSAKREKDGALRDDLERRDKEKERKSKAGKGLALPEMPKIPEIGIPNMGPGLDMRQTESVGLFGWQKIGENMGGLAPYVDLAKQQLNTQRSMLDALHGIQENTANNEVAYS